MKAKIVATISIASFVFSGCGAALQTANNMANNPQIAGQMSQMAQSTTQLASNAQSSSVATSSKKGVIIAVKDLTDAEYNTGMADASATIGMVANIAGTLVPGAAMLNTNAQNLSNTANNIAATRAANASKQIVAQELTIKLENGHEVVTKQPIKLSGQRKLKKKDKVTVELDGEKVVAIALSTKKKG